MTPEAEYAARSQLSWRKEGADWVLYRRGRKKPLARVKPPEVPGDVARLKDRELAKWTIEVAREQGQEASKPQQLRGSKSASSSLVRYFEGAATPAPASQARP
jgi:hypothetical protein